jgi:hypothetical protein
MIAKEKLEQVDAEVRAHEETHLSALGVTARGGATFDYIILPDGSRFAVGGSVRVSMSPVPGDPEATIRKAKMLIQGAYAVGTPSAADMRVAAEAYQMEMEAQRELDRKGEGEGGPAGAPAGLPASLPGRLPPKGPDPRGWFA